MDLSPLAHEFLQRVEAVSGTPIEVVADATLTVLAKVSMARPGAPHHLLRVPLNRPVTDYAIAYQCGFVLRLFANPPAERFEVGFEDAGRAAVAQLLQVPRGAAQKLGLTQPALAQLAGMLYAGLLTELRSLPIGMCIDRWIYDSYPALRAAQSSAINEQQRTNAQVFAPQIRDMTPSEIYAANLAMNAAYALFCDELYGEGGYSVAYRSAGFSAQGAQLLEQWRGITQEPTRDRERVDAWARTLGLANWYRWVPLAPAK